MEPPSIEPLSGLLVSINSFSLPVIIGFVIMLFLLAFSALVSGSEVAYFSLSPSDKDELQKSKDKADLRVVELLENPKTLLANILIANNFINIAIVVISTYIVGNLFTFSNGEKLIEILITVVGVTFLILLVGEVIPKVYATNNSVGLSRFMSSPMIVIGRIFAPLSKLLVKSTSFIDKKIKNKGTEISINDLENALEIADIEDATEDDKKILKGIVRFGNTDVKQIMKSRVDVIAFDKNKPFKELIPEILEAGYSRIPVYEESFDNVVGILYVKDLLPHIKKSIFNWSSIVREPFFVPEMKMIDDLLRQFQEGKVHMAVVVDEYGGTSGIVTLEDVIEEIIGEITDEFDDDDLVYSKLDEHNYVFEGKISLVDMYKVLDIEGDNFEEHKGEADTLAGFLIEQSGKILKKNEKLNFDNYTLIVEAADKRRIKQVKLTINQTEINEKD